MKKILLPLIALAVAALALTGCFRKNIESSPPAKRPVAQDQAGPAEKPGIISETYTVGGNEPPVIEETHETDTAGPTVIDESEDVAPAENNGPIEVEAVAGETTRPDIGGDDLDEEAAPAPATPEPAAQAETAPVDHKAGEAFEPVTDPEDEKVPATEMAEEPQAAPAQTPAAAETGSYFVQVGAFSDLENANKVLADLLSRGYKGSMLEKTDAGMYRVHAGAFANRDDADAAFEALKADFPKGFVLKAE